MMMKRKLLLLFGVLSALNINAEIYEGSCGADGDNVKYSLDTNTGILEITGTGSMNNYSYSSPVPWYSKKSHIKSVEIADDVTSIGSYAFYECSYLSSITIPNGVISIGSYAFYGCYRLTSITIPDNVTSIGVAVFSGCSGLTSVTIPNNVTSIGDVAFNMCSGLTSITIPSGVTSIGSGAFSGCSGLTSVTIPTSVTSIGDIAFSMCPGLTKVTLNSNAIVSKTYGTWFSLEYIFGNQVKEYVIGNDVTSIGYAAFANCSGLTLVTIPNSVTSIGAAAFANCSGLTLVTIPNSVTSIGGNAFSRCSNLTKVTLNSNDIVSKTYSSSSSLRNVFGNQVKEYNLGDNVTSIGNYAFCNCTGLTSITIPNGVTSIGSNAFTGCYVEKKDFVNLSSLDAEANNYWGANFVDSRENECAIIDGVLIKYVGNETSVTIPNSVTSIGNEAFMDCSSLTSVTIPNSVTSIGNQAFSDCTSLASITIPNSVISIGDGAFTRSILTSITIPNSVTSIGQGAFVYCYSLTTVSIGNGITSIGDHTFLNCSSLTSIIIPNGVISIGIGAFHGCSSLTSIDIPNSVTSIGSGAFYGCSSLTSIDIPNSVTSIGSAALHETAWYNNQSNGLVYAGKVAYKYKGTMPENTSVILKDGTISIGNDAFSSYSNLISVTIPNSVTSIGASAFSGCSGLISVVIDNGVTSIGEKVFYECTSLTSATIPNSIVYIGKYAYSNCSRLSSLIIEDGEDKLDFTEGNIFYGCPLSDLYVGRNIIYAKNNSPFKNNKEGLKTLKFGEFVTEIGDEEFSGFKGLTSIEFPQKMKTIGSMAFYGCEGLTEMTIPGSVTEIGQQAFDLCNNLKTLRLDDGKELLKFTAEPNNLNNAFQNSPLEEIYLGRNFIFTGNSPLAIFETLKSITIGEEVSDLAEKSFIGCPNLKDVTSYSKVVPTTSGVVFTPPYLPSATLHVPYVLYDEYKVANVWKEFGTIVNFEGLYNLVYNVDGEEYKKYVVEQGTTITPETAPYKEGYTFSGWSEIPATMPAHDVIVTGTFTLNTGIDQIMSNRNSGAMIFTIDGKRLSQPQRGLNIVRMSDGTTKKVVVK